MELTALSPIAGLAVIDSNFIVGDGTKWVAEIGNTARTSLGLGTGDSPTFTALTLSETCTVAGGLNVLRVTGLQTDGTAMTGTLRGAYIDVSNGSTAATGTIRGMELKARTEAPGDIGNNVTVLEGLSISADSKDHSVTTMRAAEFILDGSTGGTITEAVGLRIANNLQANKATTSYGLQIYRDSFNYTADIKLSDGSVINKAGRWGIGTASPSYRLEVPWLSGDNVTTSYFGSGAGSNDQKAILGRSASTIAIHGQSTSSTGIYGQSTSGTALGSRSETGKAASFVINPASTNTNAVVIRLQRLTSGTAANDIGAAWEWKVENDAGNDTQIALTSAIMTDVTAGAEHGALIWATADSGDDGVTERMRLDHDGNVGIGTTSPDAKLQVVGASRFGEDTTNYSEFETDGTLKFNGNATVFDDIRIVPGSFDRPGVSDPSYVAYDVNGGGVNTYLTEWAKNDVAGFTVQIPHSYDEGENIDVHLHWTPGPNGADENGATVGWKIQYSWANINGNFGNMTTADLSDACDGTDHKHQMTPTVAITGTGKTISSMLVCNITRTDTGADDTWAGSGAGNLPMLLEVDFHFPKDTVGSRAITTK